MKAIQTDKLHQGQSLSATERIGGRKEKSSKPDITHEELISLLRYNPLDGRWTWLQNRSSNKVKAGAFAGSFSGDRLYVCVKGKVYLGSKLAWFYMTGQWPTKTIDHIDFDTTNDAWKNLRELSLLENSRRRRDRGYT